MTISLAGITTVFASDKYGVQNKLNEILISQFKNKVINVEITEINKCGVAAATEAYNKPGTSDKTSGLISRTQAINIAWNYINGKNIKVRDVNLIDNVYHVKITDTAGNPLGIIRICGKTGTHLSGHINTNH
jgi:hypothetical protein